MAQSRAERLRRKKELEAKRRKKIQSNPQLLKEQNEKRRKAYAKKAGEREAKKNQMSLRAKRKQRKYWRERKRMEKELKALNDAGKKELNGPSHQEIAGKKKRAKNLAKCYYKIKLLEIKNEELRVKLNRYRVRLFREKNANRTTESPKSKLNAKIRREKLKISEKVRRQILFGDAVKEDMISAFSTSPKKLKREMMKVLTFKFLKKYRFMSEAKPFFHTTLYEKRKKPMGSRRRAFDVVKNSVVKFYEQDDVSTLAPGKKDYVTRKKVQKQKRYLCHSQKYLHRKFCNESKFIISYSVFCSLKPFWVVSRHISERDTCLCIKCENMNLIFTALRKEYIFKEDLETVIGKMCCSSPTIRCYYRKCHYCRHKIIEFAVDGRASDDPENDMMEYDQWETIEEDGRDHKKYKRTVKIRKECTVTEAVDRFFLLQVGYTKHIGRIRHQYKELRSLKESSTGSHETIIIHCDFSENYSCKYYREIQSCHFGGNKKQISLHTGILYIGQEKVCFCTLSADLHHDAVAVWAHLYPVLNDYKHATAVHFISDSPSSQYRNCKMFQIFKKKVIAMFPLVRFSTWNFLESAHGKAAADGVGGTVKRTCDRMVAANVQDVTTLEELRDCLSKYVSKVRVLNAADRDEELVANIKSVQPIRGQFRVH